MGDQLQMLLFLQFHLLWARKLLLQMCVCHCHCLWRLWRFVYVCL